MGYGRSQIPQEEIGPSMWQNWWKSGGGHLNSVSFEKRWLVDSLWFESVMRYRLIFPSLYLDLDVDLVKNKIINLEVFCLKNRMKLLEVVSNYSDFFDCWLSDLKKMKNITRTPWFTVLRQVKFSNNESGRKLFALKIHVDGIWRGELFNNTVEIKG